MFEEVINFLGTYNPIDAPLETRLNAYLFYKKLRKKDVLLMEGQVCDNVYFIAKGQLRTYAVKGQKEMNLWFLMERDVVFSADSFLERTPSLEYIQALKETELIGLSYEHLQLLYDEFPAFERIGRKLTSKYYAQLYKRSIAMAGIRPAEKYRYILENHPAIIQGADHKQLATYLGMSGSTLTRAKNSWARK